MRQYLDLMQTVLESGVRKEDRTGVGTLSVFGYQNRYDLAAGVSHGNYQEAPLAIDHPRTALVSERRHQYPLSARQSGDDLG